MSVDHDSIKANDLLVEGKRLYDTGKYEEAVASFDKAIEIKPKFADVWNGKGDALQKLERYEDAIANYDKVIEVETAKNKAMVKNQSTAERLRAMMTGDGPQKSGTYGIAWRSKGIALAKLERYEDAIACYDEVIAEFPSDAITWDNKRIALAKLGEKLGDEYDPR